MRFVNNLNDHIVLNIVALFKKYSKSCTGQVVKNDIYVTLCILFVESKFKVWVLINRLYNNM